MKDIHEITEQLEKGVQDVFQSGRYTDYLDTMSRFYNYSANNCMLILMQMPEATYIASYKAWQKDFKRQVKKGEKAIKIIAPILHKYMKEVINQDGTKDEYESQWISYKAVPVFDISQTEGEALPTLVERLTGDVEGYNCFLQRLVSCSPVPVEYEDIRTGALGYYSYTDKRITVQQDMSQQQTVKTIIHEIAHAILHGKDGDETEADRGTKEVQAESVAYTVCKWLGVDTDDYSFGYIAGWSNDKNTKELTASMEVIRRTAKTIIEAVA